MILKAVTNPSQSYVLEKLKAERNNTDILQGVKGLNCPRISKLDNPDEPYLVLEGIVGSSLAEFLRSEPILSPRWFTHLASALITQAEILHNMNLVHLDIKPGNIMLSPNLEPNEQIGLEYGKDPPTLKPKIIEAYLLGNNFKLTLIDLPFVSAIGAPTEGEQIGTPFFAHNILQNGRNELIDTYLDVYSIIKTLIFVIDSCNLFDSRYSEQLKAIRERLEELIMTEQPLNMEKVVQCLFPET